MAAKLTTLCVQCGPDVGIDGEGCCVTCGGQAQGEWAERACAALADMREAVALLREFKEFIHYPKLDEFAERHPER